MSEEVTENEGGSGKVFLVLGLLIGAGLGAGGGFYMFSGSSNGTTEEAQEVQAPKGDLTAIPFERLAVPIYVVRNGNRRYIGNYFIDLQVNVRGADNQIAVKRSLTQLQHGFISAITKNNVMREDSPTELDIDKAANILKSKAAEVIGAGIVESVTITKSMRIGN